MPAIGCADGYYHAIMEYFDVEGDLSPSPLYPCDRADFHPSVCHISHVHIDAPMQLAYAWVCVHKWADRHVRMWVIWHGRVLARLLLHEETSMFVPTSVCAHACAGMLASLLLHADEAVAH
jgi:hypothetical protein